MTNAFATGDAKGAGESQEDSIALIPKDSQDDFATIDELLQDELGEFGRGQLAALVTGGLTFLAGEFVWYTPTYNIMVPPS